MNSDFWNILLKQYLESGISVLVKIGFVILFYFIGKWVIKIFLGIYRKIVNHKKAIKVDKSLASFMESFIKFVLYLGLTILILIILGVKATTFAAIFAAFGVGLGIALKDSLSNFAGGLLLLFFRPYNVGDFISFDAKEGTVTNINIFATTITTLENKEVILANGEILKSSIINYTKSKERKLRLLARVDNDTNWQNVEKLLLSVVEGNSSVIKTQEKSVNIDEIGSHWVILLLEVWVLSIEFTEAKSSVLREIKLKLDENNLNVKVYPKI